MTRGEKNNNFRLNRKYCQGNALSSIDLQYNKAATSSYVFQIQWATFRMDAIT